MFFTKHDTVWLPGVDFDKLSEQLRKTLLRECIIEIDVSKTWFHFNVVGSRLVKNAVLGPDVRQNVMSFEE